MKSRIASVLAAAVVLAATAVLSSNASATPPRSTPAAKAVTCGTWRWAVKTLSDQRARDVDYSPIDRGVDFLRKVFAPSGLTSATRRIHQSPEMHVYRVHADLIQAVREPDRDIHLVISVPGHPFRTLITEFPDIACKGAAWSHRKAQIASARRAMLADCGDIGSGGFTRLNGSATITGVGFFDESHGQTGASPNGIEIHPVLSYRGSCSKAGSGGGGGGGGGCSPAYPDFCIPPPPPDLDCGDPPIAGHHDFKVLPPDPHGLDGDGDGVGCES